MAQNKQIFFIVIATSIFCNVGNRFCQAITSDSPIKFGSKNSAFAIRDNAAFKVLSHNPMVINGGNISNTGLGTFEGNEVRFNRGVYTFFNSISEVQGGLATSSNTIVLDNTTSDGGGTMIANPGGLARVRVHAQPGFNLMRGQPLFFGQSDITLKDNTTVLALAVQNTVNTNIKLNGGILGLQDDLRLGDESIILDSGTVVFNNRRLSLGGKASLWSGDILWYGAQDIQLNSAITLDGRWSFLGDGQINGNGNVIDIAGGGAIVVLDNSTLRLAGVHIKGIGASGTIKLGNNATLILTDAVLEMDADYNIDSGTVFVEGNSTVITKNHILSFIDGPNGSVGKLIVDRVAFTYDTLASIDQLNVRPALINDPERRHVEILGKGEIRTFRSDTITFHNYRSEPTLQKYAIVAPYRKFEVFPEVDNNTFNYNVLIDGNTNFLGFTFTEEEIFILTPGVQATTQNIILRDFSPSHVKFMPNTSLTFGNSTMITISRNETLNYPWVFQGTTTLKGAGNILTLGPGGAIIVKGQNSRLLLDSITIKGINGENVRCIEDSAGFVLKNVTWLQSGDTSFNQGSISLLGDATMVGGLGFSFNYNTTQPLTILPYATFSLIREMVFGCSSNGLQFTDKTSALFLDKAVLAVPNGLNLSNGRVIIRDQNITQGPILYNNVTLDLPTGASLQEVVS